MAGEWKDKRGLLSCAVTLATVLVCGVPQPDKNQHAIVSLKLHTQETDWWLYAFMFGFNIQVQLKVMCALRAKTLASLLPLSKTFPFPSRTTRLHTKLLEAFGLAENTTRVVHFQGDLNLGGGIFA